LSPSIRRPILREILSAWKGVLNSIIISGTGISRQVVEEVLGSVVAKDPSTIFTVTDTGAFDDEDDQRTYLEQYLPSGYLNTAQGKYLATRVGYWLHGR
jgi:hypothetical protein